MPEIVSKIPIGFNLDGYDFLQRSDSGASTFDGTSGVDAAWGGGLEDNRWVADKSLKQVQFECTHFQSVPLIHINQEGKKEYVVLSDATGLVDKVGDTGDSAYGGSIFADCKLTNTEVFNKWAKKNRDYNGGNCDDFTCGCGICPITLRDYLNHFYNLGIGQDKAEALCQTHALCVEVLYNVSVSQGRALRVKVVDSSGNTGYQGSLNNSGGWNYSYDVLDTMAAVLLSSDFKDVAVFNNTKYGILNGDELYFPWKDKRYNYRTGTIPGYSVTELQNLGLEATDHTVGATASLGWKSHYTVGQQHNAVARGRFFAEQTDRDKILRVIPEMPNDFFVTNYTEGAVANYNTSIDLSQYSSISAAIADTAKKIFSEYINYPNPQSHPLHYIHADVGLTRVGDNFPKYIPQNGINCDAFVNWVLLEAGVTNDTGFGDRTTASDWSANNLSTILIPGYKVVSFQDISQAEAGDILVYISPNSHCAIFDRLENGSVKGYGMGTESKASGEKSMPAFEPGTSGLKEILRILKA